MAIETSGIHHITAIVRDPQQNIDFYESTLGLRLVKKTINFDDPGVYHFYFGDEVGTPGTIMTFFPIERATNGTVGTGQVERTLFRIPKGSLSYWKAYLMEQKISVAETESGLWFEDPEGLKLGLVEDDHSSSVALWHESPVNEKHAIRGFYGAILASKEPLKTSHLLEAIGYEKQTEEDGFKKLKSEGPLGEHIWINSIKEIERGRPGAGTVHHIAFRTAKESDQEIWQAELSRLHGLRVTPVMDRQYFKSVYFHEPGGILFEIATDEPGFVTDEDIDELGQSLKLPSWLENKRSEIEAILPSIQRGV